MSSELSIFAARLREFIAECTAAFTSGGDATRRAADDVQFRPTNGIFCRAFTKSTGYD